MNHGIAIHNLTSGYGKLPVLHDISLTARPGSITTIVGPNGAGKTTLIKSIVNLVTVMSGQILFGDVDITGKETHKIVEQGIGFVPQTLNIFPNLSVHENLELSMKSATAETTRTRIEGIYRNFPRLQERTKQQGKTLSGGERQMLAIGSALLSEPNLLILDEPVTGLSPQLTEEVINSIVKINKDGTSILWVVEENPLQVLAVSDTTFIIQSGAVKTECASSDLIRSPDFNQIFMGIT